MKRGEKKEKLGSSDWERATLEAIADEGLRSISIPKLARRLGVTKGSFYWHFDSLDSLLAASLKRWERSYTDKRIEQFEKMGDSLTEGVKVWSSEAEVTHKAQVLYLEISNAAANREDFAEVVARVISKRVAFIEKAFVKQGMSEEIAHRRSVISYAGYVGMLHMTQVAPKVIGSTKERSATVKEMARILNNTAMANI